MEEIKNEEIIKDEAVVENTPTPNLKDELMIVIAEEVKRLVAEAFGSKEENIVKDEAVKEDIAEDEDKEDEDEDYSF